MLYASNSLLDMINEDNIHKKLNLSIIEYNKKCKSFLEDNQKDTEEQKIKIDNFFIPQNKKITDIFGCLATLRLRKNPVDEELYMRRYLHKETNNFPKKIAAITDSFLKELENNMQKKKINLLIAKTKETEH